MFAGTDWADKVRMTDQIGFWRRHRSRAPAFAIRLALLATLTLATGCAAFTPRNVLSQAEANQTQIEGFSNIRFWGDSSAAEISSTLNMDPHGAEALRQAIFGLTKAVDRAEKKFLPNLIVSSLDEIGLRLFACFSQDVLAAESTPAAPSAVELGRVEQYLVEHYTEPPTLETLADISGVSARNVIWYFRMRYGSTPQQYLERVRLQMAHLQLRIVSGNTVESVALHCGFPSVAAFERSYRQQFGAAPIARDPPPAPPAAWPGREGAPE